MITAVPATVCLGAGPALAVLAAVAVASLATNLVFSREEKEQLVSLGRDHLARWRFRPARWRKIAATGLELECAVMSPEEPL